MVGFMSWYSSTGPLTSVIGLAASVRFLWRAERAVRLQLPVNHPQRREVIVVRTGPDPRDDRSGRAGKPDLRPFAGDLLLVDEDNVARLERRGGSTMEQHGGTHNQQNSHAKERSHGVRLLDVSTGAIVRPSAGQGQDAGLCSEIESRALSPYHSGSAEPADGS